MIQKTYRVWFYRAIYDYALLTYRSLTYLKKCCQTTLPIIDLSHLLSNTILAQCKFCTILFHFFYNYFVRFSIHNPIHYLGLSFNSVLIILCIFSTVFLSENTLHFATIGLSFDSVLIFKNLKWDWNKSNVKLPPLCYELIFWLGTRPLAVLCYSIIPRIIHIR